MSVWGGLGKLRFLDFPEGGGSPERYRLFRRKIIVLMILVTVVPLVSMAIINSYQYQVSLREEIVNPLLVLVNKTKHSIELFLAERLSTVSFIATAYNYEQLADESNLNRIFQVMKREFGGFVDLGLIDENGIQVSYIGPYELHGRNYSGQPWFHEVQASGTYVSDVFMGFRGFPHMIMAVQTRSDDGKVYIVRATIDTKKFDELLASMQLDQKSDGFLVNKEGILQTVSKNYGTILDSFPFALPPFSSEASMIETRDSHGRDVLVAYTYFLRSPYILMVIKPRGAVFKSWYTLKTKIFYVFLISVCIIFFVVFNVTHVLVHRMLESEEKREAALHEVEHSQKLSSIGRLAAGVAHEINNPMAIINEKAGLMRDLIELGAAFPEKEKFLALTDSITGSVERCRSITHRLLGFVRRMDAQIETLNINEVLRETLGFLEKEALYRNIEVRLELAENLPVVSSDRGQLQQVFLNILSNAFAAVENGGKVSISSWDRDADTIAISFTDNGCGMSEETLKRFFEPFYTTKKKGHGTGLGMFITYGIVKRLGGEIEVQSRAGEGTAMTVYLPRYTKDPG
jgi:two-component system NtrC family sensor kinase